MRRDQFRLRQQFKQLKTKPDEKKLEKAETALQNSITLRQSRKDRLPSPELDQDLPLFERADEIRSAITENQVVVISGETGSGKSTQLPLICLQAGYGVGGYIGHTQPRRIAARGVAARIAQQMKCKLGDEVGFKIRFSDQSSDKTYIKLMTDGILLAETQTDRFLDQYEVIIVDEAHERSLNIDFLLGYLKRLLPKRPDLRLIITSATIDTERFASHFANNPEDTVPVIHVEGRTYPVDIQYKPVGVDQLDEAVDQTTEEAVVEAVVELTSVDRGDMLVFLPTEHDIRVIAKKLRSKQFYGDGQAKTEVLPLYARLSSEQQNLIFQPGKHRRIVLATNVAESSITVPGIRYVIDTGTARISRYAPRSKVQRLPIESISQASANQRAGRCGRVGPGTCIRLYSEEDFENRAPFTTPEIRRTNLASVILQTKALKLGAIEDFPFLDPPRPESIRDGYKTLLEIGAVDDSRNLTSLGRKLSRLPVDPRIGRMLFAASENNCLAEVLIIAAGLEVQDPRMRPAERQKAADELHARFNHEDSDFISWLNLWDFFHNLREKLSRSKFRKACQENFLSFVQIQQWSDIHRQLREMAKQAGLHYSSNRKNYQAIHSALATGLLSGVAMLSNKFEYTGAGGIKFNLWPGSGLFKSKPKWVIVSEIVETTKRYGRTVARIEPEWIEPLAEHIVKRKHVDPHWSKRRETTMAYENVSLFGLPIVARRRVNYAKIDPVSSRKLLIEKGLVLGEVRRVPEFLKHNLAIQKTVAELAAKTRRRDLILDEYVVEQFYESRIPEDVADLRQLDSKIKKVDSLKKRLRMTTEDLLGNEQVDDKQQFPDEALVGNIRLPITYRFAPGEADDGATLEVPVEAASQLDQHQIGWLVPGLICDRIEAMIRSLPKAIRRNLIPAPDTARDVTARVEQGSGSFVQAVATQLSSIAGEPISPEMFDETKIDTTLKLNLRLIDDEGNTISQSRNLDDVIRDLPAEQKTSVVETADTTWHQDGLTDWNWGELPESVVIKRGVADVPVYPTIIDQDDSVGLRLLDQLEKSEMQTRSGLTRLFQLMNRKNVKSQVNWLPELDKLSIIAQPIFGKTDHFKNSLGDLIVRIGFIESEAIPRCDKDFEQLQNNSAERIGVATQEVAKWLPRMLETYQQVRLVLEKQKSNSRTARAVTDIREQLSRLFETNFLSVVSWSWLRHYPRYLQAIAFRLEKLGASSLERDQIQMEEVGALQQAYDEEANQLAELSRVNSKLERVRWLIEEYRVSLFAQQLGTSEKVSAKRIEKELSSVR